MPRTQIKDLFGSLILKPDSARYEVWHAELNLKKSLADIANKPISTISAGNEY